MAINKKLVYFKKKLHYTTEVGNGLPNTSISFIEDTKEIITHGTVFKCSNGSDELIEFTPTHTYIGTLWKTPGQTNTVNNACWQLSGKGGKLSDLGEGSYLIQITHPTDLDGGVYTGYFSYTTGSGTDEEIILHRSGNTSLVRLYAKIKHINPNTYLLLSSTVEERDCTELRIKIKKLL